MPEFDVLKKVMQQNVVTITKDKSLVDACQIMANKNIGSIIVVDKENIKKAIGIFTERDLVKLMTHSKKDITKYTVEDVMISPVNSMDIPKIVSRHPYITLIKISELMQEKGFRRVPIIVKDELIGIVTETDLACFFKEIVKKHLSDVFKVDLESKMKSSYVNK
jgi:CBS domain-containing protein